MKLPGLAAVSLAMLGSIPAIAHSQSSTQQNWERGGTNNDVPDVRVWLDDRSFHTGDLIRPRVEADADAYVTVFRVSTDGQIKILYPANPSFQERYRGGMFADDLIPVRSTQDGTSAFYIRESTGNGFVFAIASFYRFNFSYYSPNGTWSGGRIANASRFGSPFQIAQSFIGEITEGSTSYSMDYVMYDVNSSQYRSRYASYYRTYGYDDYYGLCLDAFGAYYTGYCRGYYGGYYYPGVIVAARPGDDPVAPGSKRRMTKPLVVDPMVPNVPLEPVPAEGRVAPNDDREAAAIARRERAMRDARLRVDPMQTQRRADPDPQVFRTQAPRPEPRMDAPRPEPRMSAPREMPSAPARVEVRSEPVRQAPPPPPPPKPVDRPQKDNGS